MPDAKHSTDNNTLYKALWISDVHLGTKDCKADRLMDFLKNNHAERIYLVGDIVDGWNMRKGVYWNRDFNRVLRRLLTLSKRGVRIEYITGNHDEFLRRFANNSFDNIRLVNRAIHTTADGRQLLVIHGDQFDGVARCHGLLKFFGDRGNALLMKLNRAYNRLRERYNLGYWSLATFIKTRLPRARTYIEDYENGVAQAAAKQGYDGVICGHIHVAASKKLAGIDYYNCGDWVDSCTALAEDSDGKIHLLSWQQAPIETLTDVDDEAEALKASAMVIPPLAVAQNSAANEADPLGDIPALIIPMIK